MLASYHTLRCSETYHGDWRTFYSEVSRQNSPQYVGHCIFKELIKLHHPLTQNTPTTSNTPLTYKETNALRYAVPRLLKKKSKSPSTPSEKTYSFVSWICWTTGMRKTTNHKIGLARSITLVNTMFEVFVAIEYELRKHIHSICGQSPNLDHITTATEDVLVYAPCGLG